MIAIIDYGAGNLFSVKNALDYLGISSTFTKDKSEIEECDKIILPGVGAFPDAMKALYKTGLVDFLKEQAQIKPFLGICLGMQMLFEKSYEFSETEGLGLIKGTVHLMKPLGLDIPHMGWNKLELNEKCPILKDVNEEFVYFVHSFMAVCDRKNVAAFCNYGGDVPAIVFNKNIYGCQFHPEKSGETGLKILQNFCDL